MIGTKAATYMYDPTLKYFDTDFTDDHINFFYGEQSMN